MMMDLSDVLANNIDQDQGRMLELVDPVEGTPTGMKFWIVGPDSETAHRARIAMMDELVEMARPDGTVSAADRETARLNCLARHVLRFEITEDGQALPFSHKMMVRILRAGTWMQTQIDAFAADRANFRPQ